MLNIICFKKSCIFLTIWILINTIVMSITSFAIVVLTCKSLYETFLQYSLEKFWSRCFRISRKSLRNVSSVILHSDVCIGGTIMFHLDWEVKSEYVYMKNSKCFTNLLHFASIYSHFCKKDLFTKFKDKSMFLYKKSETFHMVAQDNYAINYVITIHKK